MKKRPRRLSAAFAKTATTPGRFGDGFGGFGLSLLVKTRKYDGVAKSWSQRLWLDGGPVNVGLGQYPIVTLSEARARALDNGGWSSGARTRGSRAGRCRPSRRRRRR